MAFLKFKTQIDESDGNYIQNITTSNQVNTDFLTDEFKEYLNKRNEHVPEEIYSEIIY